MSGSLPVVFVVDDDISVRESLELLIRTAGWQPELFESAQEFLSCPKVTAPSCPVLDVNLPGLNGLDLQKQVAAERINIPIIFITGYGDVPTTVQAMKAGAAEFLTKPFSDEVLLSAIQHALERSRSLLGQEAELQNLRNRYASLSRREREVMALVVRGLLNKQVGFELGISEHGWRASLAANRAQFYRDLPAGPFYGFNRPGVKPLEGVIENWWRQGMMGGAKAHYEGIKAFSETDQTEDLKSIDVPTLVMHGDDDQVVPYKDAALRAVSFLKRGTLKIYPGFPHGMLTTHADVINRDLLAFIRS